ncbi:MAG: FMN-binding protein [Eubacteriales bacterium]|nr:FMN-binding protein [Eubacteriales bacterium]
MKQSGVLKAVIAIAVSAVILFATSMALKGVAAANTEKANLATMKQVLPGSETFTEEEYTGEDANIVTAYKSENGYVVETKVFGYVDNIVLWVGVSNDGTVTGMSVREISETPGLGQKALTDPSFLSQFLDTKGDAEIGTNIDAITGATVSSKAITKSINSAVGFVTGADVASSASEWGDWDE